MNKINRHQKNWASPVAALVAGAGTFALLRLRRKRGQEKPAAEAGGKDWLVDEAIEESFPASDPPPWTLGEEEQAS